MITETKEIYKCEYCKKLYQLKHFAEKHEESCFHNPKNKRVCFDCNHLIKKKETLYFDRPDGPEYKKEVDLFYCGKLELFLYPPKVENKKNWFDLGDDLNEPMKKECEFYNPESNFPFL